MVERWRPRDERPEILVDQLSWLPRTDAAPLTIGLEELFASVLE